MSTASQAETFLTQIDQQAREVRVELQRREGSDIRPALAAIANEWIAAPIEARRKFVARRLSDGYCKSAIARAMGLTRNRFRYLLGEA